MAICFKHRILLTMLMGVQQVTDLYNFDQARWCTSRGHYMLANKIPGWEEYVRKQNSIAPNFPTVRDWMSLAFCLCRYYIGYKMLKKRIKHYSTRAKTSGVTEDERYEIVKSFSEILDSQVTLTLL